MSGNLVYKHIPFGTFKKRLYIQMMTLYLLDLPQESENKSGSGRRAN